MTERDARAGAEPRSCLVLAEREPRETAPECIAGDDALTRSRDVTMEINEVVHAACATPGQKRRESDREVDGAPFELGSRFPCAAVFSSSLRITDAMPGPRRHKHPTSQGAQFRCRRCASLRFVHEASSRVAACSARTGERGFVGIQSNRRTTCFSTAAGATGVEVTRMPFMGRSSQLARAGQGAACFNDLSSVASAGSQHWGLHRGRVIQVRILVATGPKPGRPCQGGAQRYGRVRSIQFHHHEISCR